MTTAVKEPKLKVTILNQEDNFVLKNLGRVAGLLRISTEKTDSNGKKVNIEKTLKNHKEKMLGFFSDNELQDKHDLYEEVVSGGASLEDRIELTRLIQNIEKYEAIFCMEITRLSRQGDTGQRIKRECQKRGILIISLNPFKIYNMQNPQDVVMYDMSITMGEYERMLTSLRVKQNKISMAKQGLNSSGSVPLGYWRNPATKKLEIEMVEKTDDQGNKYKEEAPTVNVVRQIFKWYLEGEGQRTICDRLNSMGIKNKNGNRWIPQSLRVVLECETYKGTLIAHNYEMVKGKMTATEKVEIENNHAAIIDPATWEKAKQFRKNKRDRSGVDQRSNDWNSKKNISILDGLVYCDCCKRKSTIKWYTNRNNFYIIKCTKFSAVGVTCNNGGSALVDIEKLVFQDLLLEKEKIENKISKYKAGDFEESIQQDQDEKALLEKQLNMLKIKMKIIRDQETEYKMIKEVEGIEDKDEEAAIASDKKENQQQRLIIQAKLEELNEKITATPEPSQAIETLTKKLDIIKELENRTDLDHRQINTLLKQIILKVNYKRVLPENYKSLKQAEKDQLEAKLIIEYIQ